MVRKKNSINGGGKYSISRIKRKTFKEIRGGKGGKNFGLGVGRKSRSM